MNPTEKGKKAETAAATYLEMRGYKIIEQNWRRPRCEIDIVAQKDKTVYFVEVRYRANSSQGSGIDSITQAKLKKMQRSAWYWVEETEWTGPYQNSVIEVEGRDYQILSFVEEAF
jgi:putative endonuclease